MNLSMDDFLELILDSPMTAVMPESVYTHFHVMDCIIKRRPTEQEFDLFFQYIQRMDLVYQIAFLRSCAAKDKDILFFKSCTEWLNKFAAASDIVDGLKFQE